MRSIRKSRTPIGCSAKRPPPKLSDPTRSVLRPAVVGTVHVDQVGFGQFTDLGHAIGPAFFRMAGNDECNEPGFHRHFPQHPARLPTSPAQIPLPHVTTPG